MTSTEMTRGMATMACDGPWCGVILRGARIVADVVDFGDGAVVRWRGDVRSVAVYPSIDDAAKVHGHEGTEFRWHNRPSDAFRRGVADAAQDACENAAFASIGGLDARTSPTVPAYIPADDREEWLRGYEAAALTMHGDDWRTCAFGWVPALMIGEPRDMTDAEMEEVLSSDETTLDAQIRAEGRDPAAVEKSVRDGLLGDVAQAKRDALRKIIEGPRG